jgi:hypothetical protein
MNNQRLRTLTTGILHTIIEDVYEDIQYLVGNKGIFTKRIPPILESMKPWLKEKVTDPLFWNDKFDFKHLGDYHIEPMNEEEQNKFWERYNNIDVKLK